jgi:electron transfer flavoprotein alpha subunit
MEKLFGKAGASMKTAIVVLPGEHEAAIRERIAAARQHGESAPEIWWFNAEKNIAEHLPVQKIYCLPVVQKNMADCYLPVLNSLIAENKPGLVICGSGIVAKNLCALLSCSTGGTGAIGVTGIKTDPQGIQLTRYVQGMQLEAAFLYTRPPFFVSLVTESCEPDTGQGNPELCTPEFFPAQPDWFEDYQEMVIEEDSGLEAYDVIFAGGRGLGSTEAASNLIELGRKLGVGVGVSRPAALNAWMPLNRMIGISGYTLKPAICFTFGISGCAPFIRGIEKSDFVISVNQDPEAAIFRYSDIGLVADCNEVIRDFLQRIQNESEG